MINQNAKLNKKVFNVNVEKSAHDLQDEIFKKMPIDKKLSLLDEFFKFGKELQNLNNRKKK
ncbi:MAG: hypothetical protein AAB411_01035 [Patescibacteria group bacterium]